MKLEEYKNINLFGLSDWKRLSNKMLWFKHNLETIFHLFFYRYFKIKKDKTTYYFRIKRI